MSVFCNYLGQLRLYSFIPFVLFSSTFTTDSYQIVALALLWLGFLVYLETRHKDPFRLRFSPYLWVLFTIPSLYLFPPYVTIPFLFFSFLYAKKKDGVLWGLTSPLWRGLQDFSLAFTFNPTIAFLSLALIIRNLIGDFRDARHDSQTGTKTIPVILGLIKENAWGYWGHLVLTLASTVLWWYFSLFTIPFFIIALLLIVQTLSYPLTPRASGPSFLDFYSTPFSTPGEQTPEGRAPRGTK